MQLVPSNTTIITSAQLLSHSAPSQTNPASPRKIPIFLTRKQSCHIALQAKLVQLAHAKSNHYFNRHPSYHIALQAKLVQLAQDITSYSSRLPVRMPGKIKTRPASVGDLTLHCKENRMQGKTLANTLPYIKTTMPAERLTLSLQADCRKQILQTYYHNYQLTILRKTE